MHVAACFCLLISNNNKPKGCLMVIADPLDHGHGKNKELFRIGLTNQELFRRVKRVSVSRMRDVINRPGVAGAVL